MDRIGEIQKFYKNKKTNQNFYLQPLYLKPLSLRSAAEDLWQRYFISPNF